MAAPLMSEGSASGSSTRHTSCGTDAPMDRDASITPRSTSLSEPSTMRATNGAAAMVSGTMVAPAPTVVPAMRRVTGMTVNSRMRNGTERSALTIVPSTRLSAACGRTPSASVTTSTTPSGSPST